MDTPIATYLAPIADQSAPTISSTSTTRLLLSVVCKIMKNLVVRTLAALPQVETIPRCVTFSTVFPQKHKSLSQDKGIFKICETLEYQMILYLNKPR